MQIVTLDGQDICSTAEVRPNKVMKAELQIYDTMTEEEKEKESFAIIQLKSASKLIQD